MNKTVLAFIFLLFFLCYLFLGTGIHGDEIIHIQSVQNWTLHQLLTLNYQESKLLYMFYNIPAYYLDFTEYYLFGKNEVYYDVTKVFLAWLSIFLIYLFAADRLGSRNAFLFSFLFVLYPIHDSVNYVLQNGQYLLPTFALIALSNILISNGNNLYGFLAGILGSFFSYASPPIAWGLSLTFVLKKQYQKFFLFILPQLIYVFYILLMSKVFLLEKNRATDIDNFRKLFNQLIFQILGFLDIIIGPSFLIKIFYSIGNISFLSLLVGLIVVVIFFKYFKPEQHKFDYHMFCALAAVAFLSLCMYALTGFYPQTAFNLGNRVAIYSSLLMSFLVLWLMSLNRYFTILLFSIFLLSMLGISDHWKGWNHHQKAIVKNIAMNENLKHIPQGERLYVSKNQYSRLGAMSHIEFFTEGAGFWPINNAIGNNIRFTMLNKRFKFDGQYLVDSKYSCKYSVNETIYVYDSEYDRLYKIPKLGIQAYIDSLPHDYRNWVQ
ncbi:MAG TPA: hypothetical protein DCG34_09435, partial [Clostridiales bacterium]|nr:hypothetical protein [Clostridiales bacterium]